ncbi:MAG: hypothetical protein V4543_07285 [Bacteroidota bacterium]
MPLNSETFEHFQMKQHAFIVTHSDLATFTAGPVHPVCSTFALAREAEWAGRLFILDIKSEAEEGIGTFLEIRHKGPAFEGDRVTIVAEYESVENGELIVAFRALAGERLIAEGKTGQRLLSIEKIATIFKR